ncbi:MAG: adenine phosphoribosyltransferase [Nannocystaceae bacterium]
MQAHDAPLSPTVRARALELVRGLVRAVPDFPRPGILFRDITPVLADPEGLTLALRLHLDAVRDLSGAVDHVVGVESRGFLFGMAVAERLKVGFSPVRKPGKLPSAVVEASYALEYGEDRLQLHRDAFHPGARVLLVDDLLATGGTAEAAIRLIHELGGEVAGCLFLIELAGLGGRARLEPRRVEAILRYE